MFVSVLFIFACSEENLLLHSQILEKIKIEIALVSAFQFSMLDKLQDEKKAEKEKTIDIESIWQVRILVSVVSIQLN